MGTAEQGYTSLGKGLSPSKRPDYTDSPATTPQIEKEKAAVESGKGKGGDPKGTVAKVKKY